jgi:hypothetical protein
MYPILWVGPANSGKLTAARQLLFTDGSSPISPKLRTLEIGDYSARYWEFPTHMEVDILDLSMMDKQILPEMLTQLLSTRDVLDSGRKLMILRHVHALSPPAATRLRACLEELVWSAGAPAMIWCTARTVNSVVATIIDGFVYRRVPGKGISEFRKGIADRLKVTSEEPASIQSYIADMLRQMVFALSEGPPTLAAAAWIRGRVYELLGLMITGSELTASLVWSAVRLAAAGGITDAQATRIVDVLARVRWVPSYRTPLILEMIITAVYNAIAT